MFERLWIPVLVAAALTGAGPAAADGPLLITHAHVIDMVGEGVRRDHAVLVEGGRIAWVGPTDEAPARDDLRTVDAQGAHLLPGLVDAHVHLGDPLEFPLYLSAGVTTIVELGGPDHRRWRDAIQTGQTVGPRLVHCGPTVSAGSAAEARATVAAHADAGFDCIKIYDDMPADVFRALTQAARQSGLRSTAHIPRNLTWEDMLTAAPDAVAHAEEFLYSPCCSEEELERMAETMRERGIALITTLTTYDNIIAQADDLDLFLARQPRRFYPPVQFRAWTAPLNRYATFSETAPIKMRRLFGFQKFLIDYLHGRGVRIVLGTDAGNTGTFPGVTVADELSWLVASGLTPYEALASATRDAAEWLGAEGRTGTIAVGAAADLLLVAASPLDDITNIRFVRGVAVGGRWLDATELRAMRDAAAVALELEAELVARVERDGVQAALRWLARNGGRPRLLALNELAYQKLKLEDAPADAVRIFRANARLYPDVWTTHASLAEGLIAVGDSRAASRAARRALEVTDDPSATRRELEALDLGPVEGLQ